MSVSALIHTRKRKVDLRKILISLAYAFGYEIVCNYLEDTGCQFYINCVSTRPIDITKETGGWEVRVTTCASEEDYILFARAIVALNGAVNGKIESEDGDVVDNPIEFYGKDWRDNHMESDFRMIVALCNHKDEKNGRDSEVELFGPLCGFCLGKNLFMELGIKQGIDWKLGSEALINRFRYSQYGRRADIKRTTTQMKIKTSDGEKSMTFYYKNGYGMISAANFILLLYSMEEQNTALLLEYEDFMKIVPNSWERFDEKQFFTTELSNSEFDEFYQRAKPFNKMGQEL